MEQPNIFLFVFISNSPREVVYGTSKKRICLSKRTLYANGGGALPYTLCWNGVKNTKKVTSLILCFLHDVMFQLQFYKKVHIFAPFLLIVCSFFQGTIQQGTNKCFLRPQYITRLHILMIRQHIIYKYPFSGLAMIL